jgi:hypothetical protein
MTITEEERHDLFEWLRGNMGPERAATLMAHLPPVGWADVATKEDLRVGLEGLGNVLRAEFYREQRNLIFAMLAANSTLAGLAFAAARLV